VSTTLRNQTDLHPAPTGEAAAVSCGPEGSHFEDLLPRQPGHPDYQIRVAFEGLDEKFCKVPDPVQPEGPVEG
jgi:hypothetical protein